MSSKFTDIDVRTDSAARSGAENMQIDEQLLNSVSTGELPATVRIYSWSAPTISLGYFQKNVAIPERFSGCRVVRRLTGGGAILHDRELTYSIALPAANRFRSAPIEAYEAVHGAIIDVLQNHGVTTQMRMNSSVAPTTADENEFLCFLRADPRDVVLNEHKVIGSAQRRRKGSILQHGSILLRHSLLTPKMLGILDLAPQLDVKSFQSDLGAAVADVIRA